MQRETLQDRADKTKVRSSADHRVKGYETVEEFKARNGKVQNIPLGVTGCPHRTLKEAQSTRRG